MQRGTLAWLRVFCCLLPGVIAGGGGAQSTVVDRDAFHLHGKFMGWVYQDDKIRVEAPVGWGLAYYVVPNSNGNHGGVLLHKGKYLLTLCSACGQASGVNGGRFSEIAGLVQPWFRVDAGAIPSPCGERTMTQVSKELERVDFWYRRDPGHVFNEAEDDCREPKTLDAVWYGSYFMERCPDPTKGRNDTLNCGGYFLHHDWLTRSRPSGLDEMVFALTYDLPAGDPVNLDLLPRRDDPETEAVLRQASDIVKSVQFLKGGR